jgi:hypothetical protein
MPAAKALPFEFAEGLDPVRALHRVHPQLLVYAGFIARAFLVRAGHRMVITSMSRPEGESRHNPAYRGWCLAFDMRRRDVAAFAGLLDLESFVMGIRGSLDIGALIEPEWMTPKEIAARGGLDAIAPHVHWQIGSNNALWMPAPDLPPLPLS